MLLSNESNKSVYKAYAPFYDIVFGALFSPGRQRVVQLMAPGPDDRILEVGIGTGLSLAFYPTSVHVTGIDISEAMLTKAIHRVEKKEMKNVRLLKMDAQCMDFPDQSMSKVALMYVSSVVPDPDKLFLEAKRVCCAGGDIFVLNHFHSERPFLRWLESRFSRFSSRIGFSPVFSPDLFLEDEETELVHSEAVNMFSYWQILHLRKR